MKNKYFQIYREIADDIRAGTYPANTKLPSEHDLMKDFNTSRETIRKALTLLSQNGFIQKIQGKGSIVLDAKKIDFPISGLISFKELAMNMGKEHRTIVEVLELIKPDQNIQRHLNVTGKDKVWEVYRVREIDGERIILDKDYLNHSFVSNLTKETCENSIYEYIEHELGLTISFAKKEISVVEPTEEDRRLLDLDGFTNIVIVKNFVYFDDASLFQYTESRHRPDKFKFVDFARRNVHH
ncbi:trehalose operon repressor [Salipaludibacillus agaradhaerens]|uniref:Trehalose operon repressor n=1 Tax=Salipaludibacillus agaradhaerens TaxID=76935 RepID=A0A9Q4B2L6_SALAG|nr:trehalose operon repressor [Salipaludibacillus agaradhaerens]MCR6097228.1 trehalose operon repressor [Salipaludibacillus agaradhaerens]MCR6105950.1 trehalose operon repressor [Salipaludibacillus agaradhaerens]MCR6113287.1 trehalose operon repressor [Salipaludibacillus agaradhaerens]MCR6117983.1 trehalose operon repressor [Salipaludibacillus agaradhaerens]